MRAIRTYSKDAKLVESRRKQIAQNATKLFIKNGYHQTSVHKIADACGIGIGSLYRYVGMKEDVLRLVIEQGIQAYTEVTDNICTQVELMNPTEAIEYIIREFYRYADNKRDLIAFAYRLTDLPREIWVLVADMETRLQSIIEKVLAMGIETGEFKKLDNIQIVAHDIMIIGEMWAVRRWLRREITLEEYIHEQTKFILNGISANSVPCIQKQYASQF